MKDKITLKNSWELLTYSDFEQLVQIGEANIPDHYRTTHILSVLTGEDVEYIEDLPVTVFMKLASQLAFLNDKPKATPHKNEYEVNGRKYILKAEVDKICTAQFLDYGNYIKEENPSTVKLASCFLIPEGHTYGDGYDINQVLSDIRCMTFQDVNSIAFFLQTQYAAYMLISIDSMERQMKKMKIPKKKRQESLIPLRSMVQSLLSSNS